MDPRINFVTLAVCDLDASRRFYVEGLGWVPVLDMPGEVIMIKVGERLILSLWVEPGFEAEVGQLRRGPGLAPVTLAYNVASEGEVDRVLETARAAGASRVLDAQSRDWGGYTGYFADPDGFHWEIAYNPGPIGLSVLPAQSTPADGLPGWQVRGAALHARFRTDGYGRAVALVNAIAELAERADHHPDLVLRYATVDIELSSHDVGRVTDRDHRLAGEISAVAAELGAVADPESA